MFKKINFSGFIFLLLFLLIDRATKLWALNLKTDFLVTPNFYFSLVFNKGISWGIFNNGDNWTFLLVSGLVCLITIFLTVHIMGKLKQSLPIFPELLILFGSISNILDRIIYSGVIDFIVIDFGFWIFPVFNLADCAIVLGVFYMFFLAIKNNDLY